jgi:hypothetical protein
MSVPFLQSYANLLAKNTSLWYNGAVPYKYIILFFNCKYPLKSAILTPWLLILGAWAEEHFSEVEQARAWYDRAAGAESLLEEAA